VSATRQLTMTPTAVVRRSVAILAGVILVGLAAQIAIPVPGTEVPLTMQLPAVLVVGALLGPRLGAASLVVYIMLGAAGGPVFSPFGPPGVARLVGPTGGYLLAFPVAAAVVGHIVSDGSNIGRLALGLVLGALIIHAGGVIQLTVVTGDLSAAASVVSAPFVLSTLLKLTVAGLLAWRFAKTTRALL
jgi:biotin transport system substrate-specific component